MDQDGADQAGGLLAPLSPSFPVALHPGVTVTLYVEGGDVGDVMRSGVEAALRGL
ncbi:MULTISPECIES: hypothetical protein [Micromonospora]|uniref:hypothetical protein n=1 Tax=Micromonospora TaxID=1873 RepID=UPI001374CEA4|nr:MULTISPECIES: hypothetical protein [unclassified Micromonospora]MBM0230079.1 hypothetical protein [Micromonospora sp. ATA51]